MKVAINKFIKQTSSTIEDCKLIIDRHKTAIENTKDDGDYKITPRPLVELFGQKVFNGVALIGEQYMDGGRYSNVKKKEQPRRKLLGE